MTSLPGPEARSRAEAASPWPGLFLGLAGLMGVAGVGLGAAAAHRGGGDLAQLASTFLLLHAAAVAALSSFAIRRSSRLLLLGIAIMALGAILFSGDLALIALLEWRPVPLAAPIGGLMLILAWGLAGCSGLLASLRP